MIANGTVLAAFGLSLLSWNGQASQPGVRPAGGTSSGSSAALSIPRDYRPSLRFDLPPQSIALPSGEVAEFGAHEIWRPMCSDTSGMTLEDLQHMLLTHKELMRRPAHVVDTTPVQRIGSFNIVFVTSGSLPAGASTALAAAETYIESFFSDPITITINCSFQALSPGVLGSTGSSYGYVDYAGMRAQIVGDMDGSDTLQSSLPAGSTCPVRYGTGSTVTNENRVFTTFANWKAVDGTVTGADANMTFSTNFAFDYDPSNGITAGAYSFRDIIIHEVGHAMGFTSGTDFRNRDMEVLDLYRFQRTDGTGDYNPDTLAEFQTRARLVKYNAPNDDHNSDLISAEYRMSDGSPYQASHFREQEPNIGLMDPALAPGVSYYPAYYSTADVAMFDVIGYDN